MTIDKKTSWSRKQEARMNVKLASLVKTKQLPSMQTLDEVRYVGDSTIQQTATQQTWGHVPANNNARERTPADCSI